MKLDTPATDWCDDEITVIGDELFDDEMEGPLNEDFAPWMDTVSDSSDTDDEPEGRPVEESPMWPQTTVSSTETHRLSVLVLDDWDPVRFEHEEPSSQCLRRLEDDLLDLFNDPLTGVYIEPVAVSQFHVVVVGPSDTPYEGGFCHFLIQCPKDYPMCPPRVRLMNTDDGNVSFNPNLYKSGRVCLDILESSDTSAWSPALTISNVIVPIQSLLTEKTHFNHWGSEERPDECESYSRVVQHETIRVAVCDAIDACLNGSSLCPGYLQQVMLQQLIAYYEKYEKVVESNFHLTGAYMREPLSFETYGRGQYHEAAQDETRS
ncbi:ubiquitin-conjugating enzyme E2 Z [Rhipicephalus sanguineus]|uniref:Ubiquitin-conjugating enzyme E2 Z n=1 Tax=Rhipicephalus sanguineus TaxID=34632 RepID=A0A9D4QGY0_RHISA|nr:ubiquitin-conjugating enzyme E2 Z [Rhipicephalus sanguineus]KAH7976879.1 hypothetical protein HPB52_020862 [Rhipicephalus sanguineus]